MTPEESTAERATLPLDDRRGTQGMWLLITTEGALFVVLFFAYFELARGLVFRDQSLPKLTSPLIMLGVLLSSSVIVHLGERAARSGRRGLGRLSALGAAALGVVFLLLQAREYRERWAELTPATSAYGSIFYTITSIHGLHLLIGVLMLSYVAALPELDHAPRAPHRAYHNVGLYWHFVDSVWLVIVALLYLTPHWAR